MNIEGLSKQVNVKVPKEAAPGGGAGGNEKPSFKDVWSDIQARMGAQPEPPKKPKKTLDKDDFLKIMLTQMKNQDPTKPFDAEKLATQMAQLTSVEQLKNMNTTLEKVVDNNRPLERLAMTNLIGKSVTIDQSRFPHVKGQNTTLSFHLPEAAEEVKVSVVSAETGETVFSKEIGGMKAGPNTYVWDGFRDNTLEADGGTYVLNVDAKNSNGSSIDTSSFGKSRIIGVSFEGSEPVFLVGNAKQQQRISMQNIVKIEDAAGGAMPRAGGSGPDEGPAVSPVKQAAQGKPDFFTFKKGVGSKNVDPNQLNPEVAAALSQYMQESQAAETDRPRGGPGGAEAQPDRGAAPIEKGFPNGLKMYRSGEEKKGGTDSEG